MKNSVHMQDTRYSRFKNNYQQYIGILVALIVLCLIFSYFNNRFFSINNIFNILQQIAVIAIAAFGMTWVILLGEIDLSIGSIIAVAGMVGAQLLALHFGFMPAITLTLLAGALMGLINGLLTAKFFLPSFIVTVATMSIYRGLVSLPTNGLSADIDDPLWIAIGNVYFLHIPLIVWIFIILFLFNHILLSQTTFGRRTYLTGGNREAAFYSGIKIDRLKIQIFILCGLMAAISGILLSARLYSAQTNAATSYELDAIAATVLGGTSLSGGVGTMIGTLIGALIIGVINNGMSMLAIPYFFQLIAKGVIILIAVWLDIRAKRKRAKNA